MKSKTSISLEKLAMQWPRIICHPSPPRLVVTLQRTMNHLFSRDRPLQSLRQSGASAVAPSFRTGPHIIYQIALMCLFRDISSKNASARRHVVTIAGMVEIHEPHEMAKKDGRAATAGKLEIVVKRRTFERAVR